MDQEIVHEYNIYILHEPFSRLVSAIMCYYNAFKISGYTHHFRPTLVFVLRSLAPANSNARAVTVLELITEFVGT